MLTSGCVRLHLRVVTEAPISQRSPSASFWTHGLLPQQSGASYGEDGVEDERHQQS